MIMAMLFGSFTIFAQEKSSPEYHFGLTFPNIGIIWHISDHVAFLSSIDFSHGWADLNGGSSSANLLRVEADLRFFISDWEGVRFYVSPKYRFARTSHEIIDDTIASDTTGYNHEVTGALGAQYAVSDRISIFGDIGAMYSRSEIRENSHSNTISTAGRWGMILYLK